MARGEEANKPETEAKTAEAKTAEAKTLVATSAGIQVAALFTTGNLASLQGSVLAASIVPAVLTYLIGPSFVLFTTGVAFGISLLVPLVLSGSADNDVAPNRSPLTWIVALLNGFVIFASVVGIQTGAAPVVEATATAIGASSGSP